MRSPTELVARYRAEGLRITPQRSAVFAALHHNQSHPSAEAVYELVRADLPHVSLRTVYSVLHELAAMGEIVQLDLGHGSARFDPHNGPHHHLVCDGCGAVFDVVIDTGRLDAAAVAAEIGFDAAQTEVVVRGTCAACSRSSGSTAHADPNIPIPNSKEAS